MELPNDKRSELIKYVTDAHASGKTARDIRKTLIDAGWPAYSVDPVINSQLGGGVSKHSKTNIFLGVLALISFSVTGILIYMALVQK